MKKQKISFVQTVLTVLFVGCFLISNILSVKQIQLPFGITMTSAIYLFPIVYILSDVFSEVYGYKWSRITCYTAFAMNILMCIFFQLAIWTKSPDYYKGAEAFASTLGSAPRILIASLSAYVIGDLVNDLVFKKMKEKHVESTKGFGIRAIASSFAGEFVDSLIFIPIAFIGTMPLKALIVMGITQVLLKVIYEVVILPVSTLVVKKLNTYEKENI